MQRFLRDLTSGIVLSNVTKPDAKLSPVSEIFNQKDHPDNSKLLNQLNPSKIENYKSEDIDLLLKDLDSFKDIPLCAELINKGDEGIIAIGQVCLATKGHASDYKYRNKIITNSTTLFKFNQNPTKKTLIFLSHSLISLIRWEINIHSDQGKIKKIVKVDDELKYYSLPHRLQWGVGAYTFDDLEKWHKLINDLLAGGKLFAIFPKNESLIQEHLFHDSFEESNVIIEFPDLKKEYLENLNIILTRSLLIKKFWIDINNYPNNKFIYISDWYYSSNYFDKNVSLESLVKAFLILKNKIINEKENNFSINLDLCRNTSYDLILIYKNSTIKLQKSRLIL